MDVLFVNGIDFTSIDTPQLGQLILKNILIDEYDVDYVNFDYLNMQGIINYSNDMNENIDMIVEYIFNKKAKILGFYTIANSFPIAVAIAKKIKRIQKDVIIIFGGPHATVVAEDCLKNFDFLDVVCLGESELIIKPLVNALLKKQSLSSLKGVAYRENNKIYRNEEFLLVSSEKLSDYTVYDYAPFNLKTSKKVTIEGGRGCPFNCSFCSTSRFWKNTFRIKTISSLIKEMKLFNEIYNIKCFDINHDLFTANREHLKEFCDSLIRENLDFNWYCSSRVDVLDFDLIDLMYESGCRGIFFGIESGSKKVQKKIKKNLNLDNAKNILTYCHNRGIRVVASFIYGLPDEGLNDFYSTIAFIEELIHLNIDQIQLHKFIPFPGTDEYFLIKDKLYFDLLKCDFSIMYNKNVFTSEMIEDMKNNLDIYPQFYVFDSEVNNQYTTIGQFVDYISLMHPFKICINILIKQFGLLNLYLKIKKDFDLMYDNFKKSSILNISNRVYDTNFIYEQFEFSYNFLVSIFVELDLELYQANLNYGKELVDFVKSEENVRIRRFEYNIEKMFKTNKLEPLTCFIVFKKIKGDIMTEQFTSIGSALKKLSRDSVFE